MLYTSELLPVCSDALTFLLDTYTIAETNAAKKQPRATQINHPTPVGRGGSERSKNEHFPSYGLPS